MRRAQEATQQKRNSTKKFVFLLLAAAAAAVVAVAAAATEEEREKKCNKIRKQSNKNATITWTDDNCAIIERIVYLFSVASSLCEKNIHTHIHT